MADNKKPDLSTTSIHQTEDSSKTTGIEKLDRSLASEESQQIKDAASNSVSEEEKERKARIDAYWKKLNSNGSKKALDILNGTSRVSEDRPKRNNSVPEWMVSLGMLPKKKAKNQDAEGGISQGSGEDIISQNHEAETTKAETDATEDAKKAAAAALAAVKNAISVNKGEKIEVSEVRNFAGQDVKLRRLVDVNSKEAQIAQQREKMQSSSSSHLDALIEQISKKRKLNILDKSKQDWGEYKEEKGLEEELDAYKKSSNQYLDRVSFLQRTELREFEREREIRLARLSKRQQDSQRD
eukprot:TRINITY_DN23481_c0_g1_i1.p1 TRINITY_DN23481_c0_g1~~TRINITY_DN23481_c0_g1_i1.p1  ORF type:complete len:297 (+),score=101.58 TRINITY_DN23481_c0_g1_i1:197-1087(+)